MDLFYLSVTPFLSGNQDSDQSSSVPREQKHDIGPGIRHSCKVSTDLDMSWLLSDFTSMRKEAETPSIPEAFSQGTKHIALLIPLLSGMH